MSLQSDPNSWRSRILKELYEHPEIQDRAWIADLPDQTLELLVSKLQRPTELSDLLDALQLQAERQD